MNIDDTIVPKSDQANADDFVSGPRTFTVAEVRRSESAEQPIEIVLKEFPAGRPWRPSKSMRRVLVQVWGVDAAKYVGRRLTLFNDRTVTWGGAAVGGIRVSHLSHIDKPMTLALTVTRGKRAPYVVKPLAADVPTSPSVSAEMLTELAATFQRKGIPESAWLPGVNRITGGSATDLECITEAEAGQVLAALATRPETAEAPAS